MSSENKSASEKINEILSKQGLEQKNVNIWKGNSTREFLDSNNFNSDDICIITDVKENLSNNFNKEKFKIFQKNFFNIDHNQIIKEYKPNIIFLDPPYKIEQFDKILKFINSLSVINNLILIIHVEKTKIINFENFKFNEERIYGISKIYFLRTNL